MEHASKRTRNERIEIRATPEEKKVLTQLAAAAGLTLTAYIIGNLLGNVIGQFVIDEFYEPPEERSMHSSD